MRFEKNVTLLIFLHMPLKRKNPVIFFSLSQQEFRAVSHVIMIAGIFHSQFPKNPLLYIDPHGTHSAEIEILME